MQALVHLGTLTPYDVASNAILDLSDRAALPAAGIDDALLTLDCRRLRDTDKARPASRDFADAG